MSEDVTTKFADFLLRHQHYLYRVENGTIQAMEAPYKKAKVEIYNKLIKLQESPLQPGGIPAVREWRLARLNAQLAEIDNVLGIARADSVGALQAVLPEVANVENMAYTKMLATQFEKIGIDIVGLPYDQINFILEHPLIYQYRGLSIPEASFFNDQKFVSTIRRDLTQSIIQGEDVTRAVRRLGVNPEVAGLTGLMGKELKGYLTMVARSEIQHVSNSVNRGIYAANQDILKGVIYAGTLDNRTCVVCGADDGREFKFTEKGGDHNGPQLPRHPHCRCCYIPLTKTWKELGSKIPEHIDEKSKLPFMGNPFPKQTYEQWLIKQPDDFQLDVLGPARYKLWKKGEFPLKEMARNNRVLTIEELEKLVEKLIGKIEIPKSVFEKPMSSVGKFTNCIISSIVEMMIVEKVIPSSCNDYVRGSGGKWFLQDQVVVEKQVLDRLNNLKLPPSWKDVVVATNPKVKVQAIGLDKAGRWQYRYSAEHIEKAAQEKFNRLKLFSKDMPKIRKEIEKGISNNDPRAYLLKMEDRTAIRVGSAKDFKAKKKAYGLTTLKNEHVIINGDKIILDFVAKEGLPAHYEIEDKVLAQWLSVRKTSFKIGDDLFPDVSATKLNSYLKEISGGDYSIKDFRTFHGTRIAYEELRQHAGKALTAKEKKEIIKQVSEKASNFLHNTPTMARNSYIDPMVWDFIGGL